MKLMTLCYLKWDGKTLFLHRNKRDNDVHNGKWNGLGGKFEKGESPEDCVKREVKEESGLDIINPKLAGFISFTGFMDDDWYVIVYTATEFNGVVKECEEGTLEWIDQDKIYGLKLWESDPIFLRWIQEGRIFSAKFYYNHDIYLDKYEVVFY